nr:unnamed protein product [Callosobruchus analis]
MCIHGKQNRQNGLQHSSNFAMRKLASCCAQTLQLEVWTYLLLLDVQYDPPDDPKEYIHRVGRTARGEGGSGHALLILRPEELGFLRYLKQAKVPLNEFEFSWSKIADIQPQEAFKAYVRAYDSHHLKTIFDVSTLDLAKVALSFGFKTPPAVDLKVAAKKGERPEKKRKGGGGFGYYKKMNDMDRKHQKKNLVYRQPRKKSGPDNRQFSR